MVHPVKLMSLDNFWTGTTGFLSCVICTCACYEYLHFSRAGHSRVPRQRHDLQCCSAIGCTSENIPFISTLSHIFYFFSVSLTDHSRCLRFPPFCHSRQPRGAIGGGIQTWFTQRTLDRGIIRGGRRWSRISMRVVARRCKLDPTLKAPGVKI